MRLTPVFPRPKRPLQKSSIKFQHFQQGKLHCNFLLHDSLPNLLASLFFPTNLLTQSARSGVVVVISSDFAIRLLFVVAENNADLSLV